MELHPISAQFMIDTRENIWYVINPWHNSIQFNRDPRHWQKSNDTNVDRIIKLKASFSDSHTTEYNFSALSFHINIKYGVLNKRIVFLFRTLYISLNSNSLFEILSIWYNAIMDKIKDENNWKKVKEKYTICFCSGLWKFYDTKAVFFFILKKSKTTKRMKYVWK